MKGFAVGLILKVRGFGGRSGIFHTTLMLPDPVQRATAKWPILCSNRVGQPKPPNDNQNCQGSIQVLTNLRSKHSTPFLDTSL